MKVVKRSRVHKPRQFLLLALVIPIVLCSSACPFDDSNPQRISELRQIAADVPIHRTFIEVSSSEDGKSDSAGVTHFYRSLANYEEVKSFYVEELTQRGWGEPKEEPINKWFIRDGSKALTFTKGDYTIEVEYNAEQAGRWQYSVDFGWKSH